jgi:iron-sulfur cluster repair protein YtfE (RIC family)
MLIQIGPSKENSDIVDLLSECHDRIRAFTGLAGRLASSGSVSDNEIRDAAGQLVRYFSESLPLHVADEEESILPRLRGRSASLDDAMNVMHEEHERHKPEMESLLRLCRALQNDPQRLPELRETLRATAATLEHEFLTHLGQEEKIIFPAIRTLLGAEDREAMLRELRARRI